jgi:riboflavin kinase/FMN adenylyltransferase
MALSLGGVVVHGDGLGKTYGYPTANINCSNKNVKISQGVYAAWVTVEHKKYKAALVVQIKPWKVETFLIDFDGKDLYGTYIEAEPVQKISELERYDTQEELIKKIDDDVKMVREVLGS